MSTANVRQSITVELSAERALKGHVGMNSGGISDEVLAFSERTASRLSGVPIRRLHEWADSGLVGPSVIRSVGDRKTVRLYTFTDLVDLLIVAEIGDRGVHTLHLRSMLEFVRGRGVSAPLREVEWAVDTERLYWREPGGPWAGGRAPGQIVMAEVLNLERIRAKARRAARERKGTPGVIEHRRGAMGSKPVFAGTRISVAAVQTYIARGLPDSEILAAYPLLKPADIDEARSRMRVA